MSLASTVGKLGNSLQSRHISCNPEIVEECTVRHRPVGQLGDLELLRQRWRVSFEASK